VTTPYFVHVHPSVDCYIVLNTSSTKYEGTPGAVYTGGLTHKIECRGMTHIHQKALGASAGSVYLTVYGA